MSSSITNSAILFNKLDFDLKDSLVMILNFASIVALKHLFQMGFDLEDQVFALMMLLSIPEVLWTSLR